MNNPPRIMVFGTFDGLHQGHLSFLTQAKNLGDDLVIVLARDKTIAQLKGREARKKFSERKKDLKTLGIANKIVAGDESLGHYEVIDIVKPTIIALGYDQEKLKKNLQHWLTKNSRDIELRQLHPYQPEKYKSSILRRDQ